MSAIKRQKLDDGYSVPGQQASAQKLEQAAAQPGTNLVLIWDLDETLVVFNSLLTGSWAAAHGLDRNTFSLLGERWEHAILDISDKHFLYEQIEECDQTCIADVAPFDDGARLADYDFYRDGFPPPAAQHGAHSVAEHAASTRPLHPPLLPQDGSTPADALPLPEASRPPAVCNQPQPPLPPPPPPPPQQPQQQPAASSGGGMPPVTPAAAAVAGLGDDDLRKLAYRYRHVSMLYRFGLQSMGTAALRKKWEALFHETDEATGHWLTHAASLLEACTTQLPSLLQQQQQVQAQQKQGGAASDGAVAGNMGNANAGDVPAAVLGGEGGGDATPAARQESRGALPPPDSRPGGTPPSEGGPLPGVVHVAVTSGQLIPSLAKLLLFRLGEHFTPDKVYSSRRQGKGHCFDQVRERWGRDSCFVVIGDGIEEDEAAAERTWPYLRVLLTDAMAYPAAHVLRLRKDALGTYGRPLPQLQVEHVAQAAVAAGVVQPARGTRGWAH